MSKTVKTVPVQIGNIGQILNKLTGSKGATEEDGLSILAAITEPGFNLLEVTLDGDKASLSLHEDFIDLLRDNGFKEDL